MSEKKNMLPESFLNFLKTFHFKEKIYSSIKSTTKNLTSMIYESFILELFILMLALSSYCGDK